MKVCLFGGTFDPIHVGHLILAEIVRNELNLDRILFIPSGSPPHKNTQALTPASSRLYMTKVGIQENPFFKVSSFEIDKKGISYSVDTIEALQSQLSIPKEDTYFLIGSDSLLEIHTWYCPKRIFELCNVVVVRRSNSLLDKYTSEYIKKILIIKAPLLDISSSDIRSRVKRGLSIKYMVPRLVEDYIYENRLYQ